MFFKEMIVKIFEKMSALEHLIVVVGYQTSPSNYSQEIISQS